MNLRIGHMCHRDAPSHLRSPNPLPGHDAGDDGKGRRAVVDTQRMPASVFSPPFALLY